MIQKHPEDVTFTAMLDELRDTHDISHEVRLVIAGYCGQMKAEAWCRGWDTGWTRAMSKIDEV